MRLGRRRLPVLAEISAVPDGARAGTLRGSDMKAFDRLLEQLDGARSVLIAGGEGRQGVAVGLATTATARGQRTVLLESDVTRPVLAGSLGLASRPGLCEYLRGEAESQEILQSAVLAGPGSGDAVEPLVCIVAGGSTATDATPLDTEGMRRAVAGLCATYELVVIDGSPLEDRLAFLSVAAQVDTTLVWKTRTAVPKALHGHVDGLIVPGR